jgi:hypothetical protein
MKWIGIAALALLVVTLVGVVVRALRWNAGVPALDEPEQVTPPPARTREADRCDS